MSEYRQRTQRLLPNGLELTVYPLLFGRARLGIGNPGDEGFSDVGI